MDEILDLIATFLALLIVLPVHEYAHALVAVKCGDDTPKFNGRLTLNPMAHFDAIGLIMFVLAKFGWAKPVPVNPNNYRKYKLHSFYVAGAGVLANYILAFIAYPLFILSFYIPNFGYFTDVLRMSLLYIYSMSLNFFVFNLIPLYPLDGFRLIDSFSKKTGKLYHLIRNYSVYILTGLFILGIIADATGLWFIDILGIIISYGSMYLGMPITMFWGIIF